MGKCIKSCDCIPTAMGNWIVPASAVGLKEEGEKSYPSVIHVELDIGVVDFHIIGFSTGMMYRAISGITLVVK